MPVFRQKLSGDGADLLLLPADGDKVIAAHAQHMRPLVLFQPEPQFAVITVDGISAHPTGGYAVG